MDKARFPVAVSERLYRSPEFETTAASLEIETHVSAGSITIA